MRTLGSILKKRPSLVSRAPKVDMTSAVKGLRLASPSHRRNKRIDRCRDNFKEFLTTYLPHHFNKGFCELHDYIAERVEAPSPIDGKRDAVIAPRKFGKTTEVGVGLPLWHLAYQRKMFVLFIGESSLAAEGNLATLTQELEQNERLLEDFPHLKPAKDPKGQLVKWTDRQIVLSNYATVVAKGMGSRMRGIKYRNNRPDLAILDDPESPETGDTFLKRKRHKRWFGGTFLGLGATGWDIFVIGNLPNHDCLIADLVRDHNWNGILFRAINIPARPEERYPIGNSKDDGSPLWPEVWSHDALEAYRNEPEVGSLGFAREMMCDPRDEEDKPFDPTHFAYFDQTLDHEKQWVAEAIAVDPAGGEKQGEYRKGIKDWCAVVGGARTKDGKHIDIYAIEMTRETPDKQMDAIIDMAEATGIRTVVLEEIMFKNLYANDLDRKAKERGIYLNIKTVKHQKENKVSRILSLVAPLHDFRTIRYAKHLKEKVRVYFLQFDEFPQGFDDGPDATEILLRALEKKRLKGVPIGMGGSSYWRRTA
jgi:predicted phage terminase large subunit-like protein